jgi:parvulin-like peptidyl-prolyl isomerase
MLIMSRNLGVLFLLAALALVAPNPLLAAQSSTNAASPAAAAETNAIVARAKALEIRRAQLDEATRPALAQAAANGRPVTTEQMPLLERQVLAQLIDIRLLLAKATQADKAAGKAEAEKRYAAARAKAESEDAFKLQLQFLATTPEELVSKWTDVFTANAVLKRELKINITDQQARQYYDENPQKFDIPEMLRIGHILISTHDPQTKAELSAEQKAAKRKRAEEVLKRARAGEDFGTLAMAYSNDIRSRAKGGEYKFARGEDMAPEIEAVAFSMKTNQISDLITTAVGYHIVKLREKIPAHKVTLAEAMEDIKMALAQEEVGQRSPEYIERLKTEAGLEILDEKLKPPPPGVQPIPTPRPSTKRPG